MNQLGDQWRIARAEQVREAMGPELRAIADALRATFGAKLSWLDTKKLKLGEEPDGMVTQCHIERRRA